MYTTTLQVPQYIAEYIQSKYPAETEESRSRNLFDQTIYVRFPDELDVYHLIYDLLRKRPENAAPETGNLHIVLPERNAGKRPETYNYLSAKSQLIISRRLSVMFWTEVHTFVEREKHKLGINYCDSVEHMLAVYDINSITSDALIKNYYRWRRKIQKHSKL